MECPIEGVLRRNRERAGEYQDYFDFFVRVLEDRTSDSSGGIGSLGTVLFSVILGAASLTLLWYLEKSYVDGTMGSI